MLKVTAAAAQCPLTAPSRCRGQALGCECCGELLLITLTVFVLGPQLVHTKSQQGQQQLHTNCSALGSCV